MGLCGSSCQEVAEKNSSAEESFQQVVALQIEVRADIGEDARHRSGSERAVSRNRDVMLATGLSRQPLVGA